jgi:hypothetical protein
MGISRTMPICGNAGHQPPADHHARRA